MFVTKDPSGRVIRTPVKTKIPIRWAVQVLAGDFIPGLSKPKAVWVDGSALGVMAHLAMAESPEFKKLNLQPQTLKIGLELAEVEKSLELADPRNALTRLRSLRSAVRNAADTEIKGLAGLVSEGLGLVKSGAFDGKVPEPKVKQFVDKAATLLEGELRRFNYVLTAENPTILLQEMQEFEPVFGKLGTTPSRDALLSTLATANAQRVAQNNGVAEQIRNTIGWVEDTFTAALAYAQHSSFEGEFGLLHIPRNLHPAKVAAFVISELVEQKRHCYDVVLLNPIPSPTILTTHWAQYFSGEEVAQATVFASLDYQTLDDLAEIASASHMQSGSAAGHLCVTAGFGTVLGRRCPIGPAVAGSRFKRDDLLNPRGGHFGVLESSFGCQPDKAIFGYDAIDTLALRDADRARFAKNGVNTPTRTDGMVHLYRANSLSSDIQFSQYDTTRAANWFIGTMRQFMRKVPIGQCNDPILKAMVAAEVTELLNAPFAGKGDFEVIVTPGETADPREFKITLSLPQIAYVETYVIYVELQERKPTKK